MVTSTLGPAAISLLQAEIDVMRCHQALETADIQQVVSHAERALSVIPHEWPSIRSLAFVYRVYAYQLVGDSDKAYQMVQDALATDTSGSTAFQGRLLMAVCFVQWANADLAALRRTATKYLKLGQEHNLAESKSFARFFLGSFFYQRNDLAKAAKHLVPAATDRNTSHAHNTIDSACVLALTYQALNQPDSAHEIVEATEALILETQNDGLLPMVEALQAELALKQGRLAEAAQWAQGYDPNLPFLLHRFYVPQLILAKILLADDTPASRDRAAEVLGQLQDLSESTYNTRVPMGVLVLQALLEDARGDEPSALDKLGHAVHLAEPGGWIRLFVDLGPRMAELLVRLSQRGVAQEYIARILAAFREETKDDTLTGTGERRTYLHLSPTVPSPP